MGDEFRGGRVVVVEMGSRVTASLEPHNQLYHRPGWGQYGTGEHRNTVQGKADKHRDGVRSYQRHRDGGGREAEEAVMAKVAFRLWRVNQSRGRGHMRARPRPS